MLTVPCKINENTVFCSIGKMIILEVTLLSLCLSFPYGKYGRQSVKLAITSCNFTNL
jgi:hypothetical protein